LSKSKINKHIAQHINEMRKKINGYIIKKIKKGDKGNLHALDQEWDSLQVNKNKNVISSSLLVSDCWSCNKTHFFLLSCQKMSFGRTQQLQELQQIIQEMSKEIMWVNDREEEELMFDWGDKNIDQYIPKKQESYSKLMSALEVKEKDLNKLKAKVDTLLKNNHPASDKIEAYRDTLQTQWSWLLQITKCIDVHLKENAAYNQFFKEANETYSNLQKEHETVRKKFVCDKNTSLEDLLGVLRELEMEKEKIMENKRQVHHLVSRSKNIVRLKPRNPEEKSSSPIIVKALCDFRQDQKVILKGNEAILKDNGQRSKWDITGPGGLDMTVPSVCLIVPPPNPLSISLANKNEQYYEAILSIWNQLFINVKSLIAWQYCLLDIRHINSLTISMLSKMRPEEYRQIIKSLETHFEEFKVSCSGSQMFADEDKRTMENQFNGAQSHYEQLVVQLPTYKVELKLCVSDVDVSPVDAFVFVLCIKLRSLFPRFNVSYSDKPISHIIYKINTFFNDFIVIRLRALRDLLESVARAEDIVKVHEARLTEKETTSLLPSEVEDYMLTLKNIKAELDQKRDVLASMEAELDKATHWNSQVGGPFHRCDMMLCKYGEHVGLLSDRWRRINGQIDTRLLDLQSYHPQLEHYKQTSASLFDWIDVTRKKQDTLQATKIDSIQTLIDHINNQKALNSEIKSKRGTVEMVLKDNEACVNSIKDYETDLASYTSGLESLLNIPIKRTMLKSPSMDLNQEATELQTRYLELLTLSGDYSKYLGELHKNMEELKIRNTRIDLLEEELRLLRDGIGDRDAKNKSLEEAVARYQLELSQSQDTLLSIEEVKQNAAAQCSATKESLDSTHSQLSDLNDQVTRLNYLLEEEKRKRRLAEERYTQQQEEYDSVLRKRQKELETVSWSKTEVEKSVASKDHEIEQLRRQLAAEAAKNKELQKEMSKVRSQCSTEISNLKLSYESQIHVSRTDIQRLENQREGDTAEFQLQYDRMAAQKRSLEEDVMRLRMSINEAEEQRKRAEEEAHSQHAVITEEVHKRRELESQSEEGVTYTSMKRRCRVDPHTGLLLLPITEKVDPSKLVFDGVRKPVTAKQLADCGVLDKPTLKDLEKGKKTVPEVSVDKKVNLKGTGPIAGVIVGSKGKMSLSEAKKQMLLLEDIADLLLEAQAATGHIIDPRTNQKLTVEEACVRGVVDIMDRDKLLAAEAAAVGYKDPSVAKPLSVFEAIKKGLIDETTGLRLLQAQDSVGGILDPNLSVFLPKDTAIKRKLLDQNLCQDLNQSPKCYLDPDTENDVSYGALKKRCKTEPHTGLLLLPITERLDPSKLVFDGVRKPVTAKQLADCGVLDKPTLKDLEKGKKTVPEVSVDKNLNLKGTGPIAGVVVGSKGKMSLSEAKKQMLLPEESADLLLEAQAATGHIIDPRTNQKLTVEEAFARGVVDILDRDRLLAAEAAAVGYQDPSTAKPLSVFEAMKKGLIDGTNGLRLLQAQESVGGILDPNLSVFLPKDTAIKRNLLDENLSRALNQSPKCYLDPDTEKDASYGELKKRCKTEPHTGLLLLPITEKLDPSKLIFDDLLLEAQAATGHIIDPRTNQKLSVEEACARGVVDIGDRDRLLAAEAAAVGYRDRSTAKPLSVFEAMKKGLIDGTTGLRLTTTVTGRGSAIRSVSPDSRHGLRNISSVSISLASPIETVGEQEPVGAIFDTETLEKISITEALDRGLVDSITAQRLLEAQACTGGIVNPTNGHRLGIQEAYRLGIIDDDMVPKLKPAQKAYIGFEDVKTRKKMSVAEAMKEMWVPYEAGQRFMEFQLVTGGLHDPERGCRRTIQDSLKMGWLDERAAQRLQDINHHTKNLTCPKSKLKISYKDALDKSLVEESTGVKMLQASSVSSRGISSPYNVSSAPGSTTGSRSGSRRSSRRGSLDLGSPTSILTGGHGHSSLSSFSFFSTSSTK
uniref:Desmoplakin b n=1 Tax=Sparus aurata TaxID=8175 RepID=A0A671W202_SPAAU